MRRFAGALMVVPLLLAGCGGAQAATRGYQVSGFSKVRVAGPFTVRIHVGGAASARATGPQDKIDRLTVEQHGDTLDIAPVRRSGWGDGLNWSKEPLIVDVSAPTLVAAALTGSGDVTIDRVRGDALDLVLAGSGDVTAGAVEVRQLGLRLTGSGDVTVAGRAGAASVAVRGSGDAHADKLVADTATVDVTGSGDVALSARRTAAVTLTGSGDVAISGSARCTVARTGSGDVRCAGGTTGTPARED